MKPKLVVFDLDGVLLDTRLLHFEVLNQALAEIAPDSVISLENHLSTYDGLSTDRKLQLLVSERGLKSKLVPQISRRKQELTAARLGQIQANHEILSVFKDLKSAGLKIAVATNSIRKTLSIALEGLRISSYVDFSISNEDVLNPKPHPEIYWKAMAHFGSLPSETVVVEDSPIGQAAAAASGATVIPVDSPQDITQTLFEQVLHASEGKLMPRAVGRMPGLQVLIPMAGRGSRFEESGYTFPKPLIEVHGSAMIQSVVRNLNVDARFIFVVQKAHAERYNLPALLGAIKEDSEIVELDDLTGGAAETALAAEALLSENDPLIIANSDQMMEWSISTDLYKIARTEADGAIWTFESSHPKWSFAKLAPDGVTVQEVAEKNPISDRATTGVYFWRRAGDFLSYARQMIAAGDTTNGEFYICPVYNWAIRDNKKVINLPVSQMFGIGTPEDLNYFLSLGRETYDSLVA